MRMNHNNLLNNLWHPALLVILAGSLSMAAINTTQPQDTQESEGEPDWVKFCVACPQHDILDNMAGVWTTTVRSWADPSDEPLVSEGEAEYQWKLGGRYLMGELNAYVLGVEKIAIHTLGYDNFRGRYQDVWVDNDSTAFQLSIGVYDSELNQIVWEGTADDVVTGKKNRPFRMITRFVGEDEMVWEMFRENESGELFKTVEATFHRE